MKWFRNWAAIAVGGLIAAHTHQGINFDSYWTLLGVVLLISLFNTLLRPLLIFFTLPFIIFTLGLGLIVINALLVKLTGAMIPGFEVASWWAALWAAVVIGLTSGMTNLFFGENKAELKVNVSRGRSIRATRAQRARRAVRQEDDVIDI